MLHENELRKRGTQPQLFGWLIRQKDTGADMTQGELAVTVG